MTWAAYTDRTLAERILTEKELEVWKLVAAGYGRRRIARILAISNSAARERIDSASRKLERAKENAA